ncbi:hypothetical protein CHGG_06268 [Paecilomyces variotii No. 5]|uniref:Uncharacterized protein n=1 Tax=Byssochlamys spectabilis (strain No. 5 / NBRC 109023) TaxID=1356009 RepID=V5G315_BYSSN|nr:hypothetical protein CHGG_06268 [Paecilomyces variotii No. 5]
MQSACNSKPNASDHQTVSLPQQLFATSSASKDSGLSTGAKAGIGVGVGLGGLALCAVLLWIFLARRRRRNLVMSSPNEASHLAADPSPQYTPYSGAHLGEQKPQQLELQEAGNTPVEMEAHSIHELPAHRPV